MSSLSIFISYSHKDEEWKDRVVTHLRVLEMEGMLDVWDDRRIETGDDWHAEIDNAIKTASIAILIISANFLTSKFVLDEEVPKLLKRRAKEGVRVIPLIVKPCAWTQVKWLSPIQARPKDGKPLSAGNEYQIDADLADLANEIAGIVKHTGILPDSKIFVPLTPDKISLAKLPSTSPDLFGRNDKLKELDDAWANLHINTFTLVAWGGVGKSALVNKWLTQMAKDNYLGAERVYGWSFYSQGAAEGRQVSADQFIASALTWFGDPDPNVGSPWDKGERLAELVKHFRTLIILDGLEPLQNPPPLETGRIKDPALVAFLREIARQNPGLVVITTRLAVDNLKDCLGDTVIEHDLDNLSPEAGAAYLNHLGVDGTDIERQDAVREFGGHALALTLMGRYLVDVYDGDIRKRDLIPNLTNEEEKGGHAKRIMRAYEKWFEEKPEHNLLTIMGLFDRPAEKGAVDALLAPPVIEGLTNQIQGLSAEKYKLALKHLRKARLLSEQDLQEHDTLDCHPLLREHFGAQLKEGNSAAWHEGNSRLYEWYRASAKDFPDTIQEMTPLFAAVMHGCQAGKHQEALDEVYWKRILRENEHYSWKKLGTFGADLATISGFFDSMWEKTVDGLADTDKSFVLGQAGLYLRALSRLLEAAQPMQSALDSRIEQKDWINAAHNANNLSELYLTIGDLAQAYEFAEQSVQLADRSGQWRRQIETRKSLANALFQVGNYLKSELVFREAEEILKKNKPEFSFLYSFPGFQYCELLLSQGNYEEVKRRAVKTIEIAEQNQWILDIALDNLSFARAHFLQSQREPDHLFTEALHYFNHSVDGLRQAGQEILLPLGLLARAEFYRATGVLEKAQKDLNEVFSIATRGEMGLYLVDCYLEYARLYLVKEEKDKARKYLYIAKEKIEKMGYRRRDIDVTNLEIELK